MNAYYLIALTALIVSTSALAAEDGETLFNKNKCGSCHKIENKTAGPSVKAIAAKYTGNADAQALLEKKVRAGGGGVWGKMPMPATPAKVNDDEIKTMVSWMLSHK